MYARGGKVALTDEATVHEAGGFWALCQEGRRHRVTAHRMVRRSPAGSFRAHTVYSLPGMPVVGNHNPAFAPAIQPTVRTGTEAAVAAALAYLGRS